jgi:hypothetical protein
VKEFLRANPGFSCSKGNGGRHVGCGGRRREVMEDEKLF